MTTADILIAVLAVLIVGGSVAFAVYRHKKGKSSCGCNCGSCPYSQHCTSRNKQQ